ncbi:MAG: AAA family ATPase [Candidatus Methanomethyliaceae archaeon]|nr:AAA family ATPase [Candidatus Methanomethyliaceae archaeon]MDW7970801.1 AAA family ATPase [Nitrososphaerota archaeon]
MKNLAILEVILENFMSYEYARVPLRRGLNLICGPNGSGKSSILLGISVATGQSYTERSKRLADLIRRGKDSARVTLILDNSESDGKRPIPYISSDIISISRYLKKDGKYWFEINGREVSKFDIERLFKSVGMNPDNMLIIMHQNMIEEFAITSPEDKLRMVEEAVGFSQYREAIYESEEKLNRIVGEEEATSQLLASAEQNLSYWKELNEKYNEKKRLLERKHYLERELIWSQIIRQESIIAQLEEKVRFKFSQLKSVDERLLEKLNMAEALWIEYLSLKEKLRKLLYNGKNFEEIGIIDEKLDKAVKDYVNTRVEEAILKYRREEIEGEIKELENSLKEARNVYSELEKLKVGDRIFTNRAPSEISDEIRFINAHLLSLGDIPEDTPSLYQAYLKTYNELKQRIVTVSENRKKVLEELEERKKVWRRIMENLIDEVNPIYREILSKVGGTGGLRLVNMEDPEKAGLEITVGFRGSAPVLLNAYSQSGGERAVATMAFLLALQHHLKSPIRAIDEFDVHMDPHNREAVMRMLFSFVNENPNVQFIIITPSQMSIISESANIIFIQIVHGKSEVAKIATTQR